MPKMPAPTTVTPRGHETDTIHKMIEDALVAAVLGTDVNLEQTAQSVVKEVFRLFEQRETCALALYDKDGKALGVYGPFPSEAKLRSTVEALGIPEDWSPRGIRLTPVVHLRDHYVGSKSGTHCGTCGCRMTEHLRDGTSWGKCANCKCDKAKK